MHSFTSIFATVWPIDGVVKPAIDIISPAPALSTGTMLVPFFFISFTTYKTKITKWHIWYWYCLWKVKTYWLKNRELYLEQYPKNIFISFGIWTKWMLHELPRQSLASKIPRRESKEEQVARQHPYPPIPVGIPVQTETKLYSYCSSNILWKAKGKLRHKRSEDLLAVVHTHYGI